MSPTSASTTAGSLLRERIEPVRRIITRFWIDSIPALFALALCWREFRLHRHDALFPDTLNFLALAHQFPNDSIWGGFREPVWTTLFAAPVAVFGHDDLVVKAFSIAGFVFLVVSVQLVARTYHGRVPGLICGLAIAASPFLAFWAVSGLREETAAATIVVFGALVCRSPSTRRAWLLLAAYAGLLAMLRWDTTTLTIPVLALAFMLQRVNWRTIALSAVVFAAIVSPLVIGNAVRNDDPMYHTNTHARFYRNFEFADQPGFPSSKTLAKDSFAGPKETWLQYIFDRHSLGTVARRAVESPVVVPLQISELALFGVDEDGSVADATWPTLAVFGSNREWMPWVLFAGGVFGAIALVRRGRWPFAALLGLASVQHFPVVQLPGYDYRLEITVYPLLILANLECIMWLVDRRRDARPSGSVLVAE